MLVGRGSLTFRCYAVSGKNAMPSGEKIVERLDAFAFTGLGEAEEGSVVGWIAGEHLFDGAFDIDKLMRGPYAVFALRVDTRKVNGALLAAHTAVEVAATMEAEGLERLGGARRREIKQEIKRRLLKETAPAQKAYGVFWNVRARRLYVQSTSKTIHEHFRGFFERCFDLSLEAQVAGVTAAAYAKENGLLEALKDVRPMQLTAATESAAPAPKRRAAASVA
ncbi:MAG: recombination-associated protein RdgC [Planctomycetes bacterium]|nr:recombination-associated protein RdgC [Planctomycetota bacterium]